MCDCLMTSYSKNSTNPALEQLRVTTRDTRKEDCNHMYVGWDWGLLHDHQQLSRYTQPPHMKQLQLSLKALIFLLYLLVIVALCNSANGTGSELSLTC